MSSKRKSSAAQGAGTKQRKTNDTGASSSGGGNGGGAKELKFVGKLALALTPLARAQHSSVSSAEAVREHFARAVQALQPGKLRERLQRRAETHATALWEALRAEGAGQQTSAAVAAAPSSSSAAAAAAGPPEHACSRAACDALLAAATATGGSAAAADGAAALLAAQPFCPPAVLQQHAAGGRGPAAALRRSNPAVGPASLALRGFALDWEGTTRSASAMALHAASLRNALADAVPPLLLAAAAGGADTDADAARRLHAVSLRFVVLLGMRREVQGTGLALGAAGMLGGAGPAVGAAHDGCGSIPALLAEVAAQTLALATAVAHCAGGNDGSDDDDDDEEEDDDDDDDDDDGEEEVLLPPRRVLGHTLAVVLQALHARQAGGHAIDCLRHLGGLLAPAPALTAVGAPSTERLAALSAKLLLLTPAPEPGALDAARFMRLLGAARVGAGLFGACSSARGAAWAEQARGRFGALAPPAVLTSWLERSVRAARDPFPGFPPEAAQRLAACGASHRATRMLLDPHRVPAVQLQALQDATERAFAVSRHGGDLAADAEPAAADAVAAGGAADPAPLFFIDSVGAGGAAGGAAAAKKKNKKKKKAGKGKGAAAGDDDDEDDDEEADEEADESAMSEMAQQIRGLPNMEEQSAGEEEDDEEDEAAPLPARSAPARRTRASSRDDTPRPASRTRRVRKGSQ